MKKKIAICLIGIMTAISVSACGENMHWNYEAAIKSIDNEYFKTKVICESKDGSLIIENEVTGEYFLAVCGAYGVSITPIQARDIHKTSVVTL